MSILLIFLLSLVGMVIFLKGFLLNRKELANRTPRKNNVHSDKVILFIIDALRFDFVVPTHQTEHNVSLPVVQDYLESGFLFKFVADPPTTTSQRLKALMTGSLPTFVEGGKNFNSDFVEEDNLVEQMHKHGKNIVILGDGTWGELYNQTKFATRARLFPSFNVWDLDTVDNGIIRYMNAELFLPNISIPERLKKREVIYKTFLDDDSEFGIVKNYNEWDILVMHFLGVDHAGHRHGVHHDAMKNKMDLMNQLLEDVIQKMDENTTLLVFGDHGMNDHGDHGGATDIEVDSSLFVLRGKDKNRNISKHSDDTNLDQKLEEHRQFGFREIPQIDLVPTLANLMGVAIPYGNLGSLIPEIFMHDDLRNRLHQNMLQVFKYLGEYFVIDPSFLHSTRDEILGNFDKVLEQGNWSDYLYAMKFASEECRKEWAQFDVSLMQKGLFVLISAFLVSFSTVDSRIVISVLVAAIGFFFTTQQRYVFVLWLSSLFSIAMIAKNAISRGKESVDIRNIDYFPIILIVFYSASMLSNSYLVMEDRMVTYFVMTFIFLDFSWNKIFQRNNLISIALAICVKLSERFIRHRSHGTHHISKNPYPEDFHWSILLWLLVPYLLIVVFYCRQKIQSSISSSTIIISLGILLPAMLASIFCYWNLQSQDIMNNLLFPRLVYAVFVATMIFWTISTRKIGSKFKFPLVFYGYSLVLLLLKGHVYGSIFSFLILQAFLFQMKESNRWTKVCLWYFLSIEYYFAMGQQNTLDTIQWTGAFVGLKEFDPSTIVLSGILMAQNIFTSKILFGLGLRWMNIEYKRYWQCFMLMLIASTVCVYIHRRHLMLWSIFAPKFLFEIGSFFLSGLGILIGELL